MSFLPTGLDSTTVLTPLSTRFTPKTTLSTPYTTIFIAYTTLSTPPTTFFIPYSTFLTPSTKIFTPSTTFSPFLLHCQSLLHVSPVKQHFSPLSLRISPLLLHILLLGLQFSRLLPIQESCAWSKVATTHIFLSISYFANQPILTSPKRIVHDFHGTQESSLHWFLPHVFSLLVTMCISNKH